MRETPSSVPEASQGQGRSASLVPSQGGDVCPAPNPQSPKGGAQHCWEDRGHPLITQQHPPPQSPCVDRRGRSLHTTGTRPTHRVQGRGAASASSCLLPGRLISTCNQSVYTLVSTYRQKAQGMKDEQGFSEVSPQGMPHLALLGQHPPQPLLTRGQCPACVQAERETEPTTSKGHNDPGH